MRRMWACLPLMWALGCLDEPPFVCESDAVCVLQGVQGTCDPATSRCVYRSVDCAGLESSEGWVDGNGNCVPAPSSSVGPSPTSSTTDPSGANGTTTAPGTSTTDDSTTSTTTPVDDESSSEGAAEESSSSDGMTSGEGCTTAPADITDQGTVMASSTFSGYSVMESVDGLLSTSWFSAGPEGGGGPSIYAWNTVTDRCIERIEVDDNSMHDIEEFQTGYGFGSATVRIVQDDLVVFEQLVELPGSPDGPFTIDTGGIVGSRVLLELGGHENAECGGFSELRVFGGPV